GSMKMILSRYIAFPEAQEAEFSEGNNDLSVSWASKGIVSGGVFDHGTQEEDGPVTWEALAFPRSMPVWRRAGDPSPTHDTLAGHMSSAARASAQNKRPHAREAAGKGHRSHGPMGRGSRRAA